MYNLNDIQSKFFTDKLITFKDSLNSSTTVLDSDLTGVSKSNRYFNTGVHPLMLLENIESMLPLLTDYTITAYVASTTYDNFNNTFSLDDIVSDGSKYYISITTANEGNAVSDTNYWKETTLLSLVLKDKIRSCIEVVLSNLITPNFIKDNVNMYRIADNTDDLIENTSKIVGFRINPISSDHLLFIINQIGLTFESDETITFSLYNQNTLQTTFTASATANYFDWSDVADIEIESKKGAWYILYDQSTLTGRAIGNNTTFYYNMYKYANITPIEMDSVSDLANIDSSNLVYDRNYGINLNFSISYDMTDFIKQHMRQFAESFHKQFEYDMINLFVYNPEVRSNIEERNININNLIIELKSFEGDTVIKKLTNALKRIKATIDKLACRDSAFSENVENNYDIGSV